MELLNKQLPLWVSSLESDDLEARLDNNWYSPSAWAADEEIRVAAISRKFKLITVLELCENDGINTGVSPEDDGEIGVIEGRNLKPNYVVPLFTKYAYEASDLKAGDLLVGKDGEAGHGCSSHRFPPAVLSAHCCWLPCISSEGARGIHCSRAIHQRVFQ